MAGTDNLIPIPNRTKNEQKEITRKGGIASGKARRQRKTLREVLIRNLEEDGGNGMSKLEILVAKCLAGHANGSIDLRDLKILQDLLGESITTLNITHPEIKVTNEEDAKTIRQLMGDETDKDLL